MSKLTKEVIFGEELHAKIHSGFRKVYDVAKASYGPNAGNALLEYPYGDPIISRDGVTNIRKLYLEDGIENATVRLAVQGSSRSNTTVGDGTTASVILAYHLYQAGRRLIAGGHNQMVVARSINAAAVDAVKQIDGLKRPLTSSMLKHVATTSAGDAALGEMISDTIDTIGADGGVTIEDFAGRGIFNEIVDGYYFRKGLTSTWLAKDPTNLESRHENVPILILEKRVMMTTDIAEIIDRIINKSMNELVIVGDVGADALGLIVNLRLQNKLIVSLVDAPYEARSLFLEDLAITTGATVITDGFNPNDFTVEQLGFASKVVITTQSTTILGSDGEEEAVDKRIKDLRIQLDEATNPVDIEMIKARLARLTGKVAIIRVGGSSEADQAEAKLRVEDAVCAAQAALKDGVVPGGAVALARLGGDFADAFRQPFRQLVENSGLNPDLLLAKLEGTDEWTGFNLRDDDPQPTSLLKAGVIDPALVAKEVITNAAIVASQLLTTSSGITLADRSEKHD